MHLMKELLIVSGRIISILPLMLIITLYMGKRSIGELPVFDFLVIITLGAVVGADIADPEIPHIHTAVAIVLIGFLQRLVSRLIIKHRKLGHIITFEPTIVIQDGKFIPNNLKRLRYSIDNILQMLREEGVFDVKDIKIGIVEASGKLSILKQDNKALITIEDLNISKKGSSLSYPVVMDGEVYKNVLAKLGLSDIWLQKELNNLNIGSSDEVFFASVNTEKELHVSLKKDVANKDSIFPLYN
ncbi:uncharacterized membrane protein YcaP (DUF421 family) [Clostridium pascui]|uniref:DUF421 domain-containing protein n=1 Tax=Clostridium pascui TaxID=46609 RepID=UPI00195E1F58|nr:DUF421 domain-containing protein [Clostridium pascui]MBM7871265.1 uncharacterized membrane protein YcaP (DUF421 family) [Clostridium pascui]